jgi:uncharacterized membrane protein YdjX (TVP38/TMEM64 family)
VLRLGILLAVLAAGFVAFAVLDVVGTQDVRDAVDAFGPLAPLAYVLIAAVLGCLLMPGPVLAAVSGLLFGALLGTVVTICSATLSAVLGLLLARGAAQDPVAALGGERFDRLAELARRHGLWAVVAQRLVPGVPDNASNLAFGTLGLAVWQIAAGTLIGSTPRAFSYTAAGATVDDPASPLGIAALVVFLLTGAAGLAVGARLLRDRRRTAG